jgi:integrase
MSTLRSKLEDYLAVRRALGFQFKEAERLLLNFVTHLERHHTQTVTTAQALAWAQRPADGHPKWWAQKLSLVRGFAKYLLAFDTATEVPALTLLPFGTSRPTPYIYSDRDIAQLITAAQKLRAPLRAGTWRTLIGLLAITGLRIGEAIGLDRQDVDAVNQVLTIRQSKFGKSREVPLHATTTEALEAYTRLRDRLCPCPQVPSFFLSMAGTRLIYKNVNYTFIQLRQRAGLEASSGIRPPRLHDLRHTFAVRTLLSWYRAGAEVEPRLPLLSTFLGHVAPSTTYWYLSAVPELLALANQRVERAREEWT